MKFAIVFSKLPRRYIFIDAPNKNIALGRINEWRNDAVAYSPNDLFFSFHQASEFTSSWKPVEITDLHGELCNTRNKYILKRPDGMFENLEATEDELMKHCRRIEKTGQFFKIGHLLFFAVRKKKKNIPIMEISKVNKFPDTIKEITEKQHE